MCIAYLHSGVLVRPCPIGHYSDEVVGRPTLLRGKALEVNVMCLDVNSIRPYVRRAPFVVRHTDFGVLYCHV
jgi:hypothetical protein